MQKKSLLVITSRTALTEVGQGNGLESGVGLWLLPIAEFIKRLMIVNGQMQLSPMRSGHWLPETTWPIQPCPGENS